MVDQEIRVLGDENIIANPKNSQKQYPLTFKAVPNVIVYGRKKANFNFTVPITEGTNFNFNLERTAIIFSDSFNLEEYSYIMVKNPFEEISDFFYVSSLEELDPTGKEFNEFNDEVVKWLRRLVNIISNRCMIFETTLFKDLNNFPNIKTGQTFIRTEDGWTGITIRDINSELDLIFNKYVEEINKKIQEHQTQMNELLEQWKQDIQKYAENVKQYEIVRIVTQTGHGFIFEPVMYSISQRKFVKALFPHGADGIAVRVDDNNFKLVWAGRVEIPATAKDTQQRDFILGEYYFLGEGSNGGIQREKPDTYYQHLFQVMYSDELRQNIADVLLSVPINQKGKRWDVGEAKTTVNDIEELKMSDFSVGKVVEVLGYYKAGDGADHKRIISATDDGSGLQLSNNLWACIVHNGEVNVSWFGAKKDDETFDITTILNKCLSLKKWNENFTIDLGKNRYYSNSILKINSESYYCNIKNGEIIGLKPQPIILFVNEYYGRWAFENINFSYKKGNIDENSTDAIAIAFESTRDVGGGFYLSKFKNVRFSNVYGAFGLRTKENNGFKLALWGIDFEDVSVFGTYGFAFRLTGGIGTPYNRFYNLEINNNNFPNNSERFENKETLITTQGELMIINADIENMSNEIVNSLSGAWLTIIGLHCEHHYFTRKLETDNRIIYCVGNARLQDVSVDFSKCSTNYFYLVGCNFPDTIVSFDNILISANALLVGNYTIIPCFTAHVKCKGIHTYQPDRINIDYGNQLYYDKTGKYSYYQADGKFIKKHKGLKISDLDPSLFKESLMEFDTDGVRGSALAWVYTNNRNENKLNILSCLYDNIGNVYTLDKLPLGTFLKRETISSDGEIGFYITGTEEKKTKTPVYVSTSPIPKVAQINTPYHVEKMKENGVYNDFITYMDEKTLYDKQQRKLEQDRQLAYEEALKENPELTYEEFMSVQPMTLNLVGEPQPSDALKKFMDKYL